MPEVTAENSGCTNMAIREFLAERLADYEIPREFVFLKEFPKTESGKIRKKERCENCFFLSKKENGLLCEIDKKYKTLCGLQGIFRGKRVLKIRVYDCFLFRYSLYCYIKSYIIHVI